MIRPSSLVLMLAATFTLGSQRASAQVQQLCYSGNVPLTTTNWVNSITIPKFDPALGTLISVGITYESIVHATARVENLDPAPIAIQISMAANTELRRPDNSTLAVSSPSLMFTDNLAAFDGVIDFAGPSGVSHLNVNLSSSNGVSLPTSPADLALFTGPSGAPGTIALPVLAQGISFFTGGGSTVTLFLIQAAANVQVCYTYDPSVGIHISQSSTVTVPGRILDYFIAVTNTGLVSATNLEVLESVDPRLLELQSVEPAGVADVASLAALGFAAWSIPLLAPGETRVLSFRARLDALTAFGTNVPGGPVWVGHNLVQTWLACSDDDSLTTPECGCVSPCWQLNCASLCSAGPAQCIACRAGCVLGCGPAGANCLRASRPAVIACFQSMANILSSFLGNSLAQGPLDPNEKRVVNRQFVQPDERLVYAVHYENVGTQPALSVFITDDLDPNLDPSSVMILTPGGTLNPTTHVLHWSLLGINLQPMMTSNVLFSAKPMPGLPPGTVVRNRATIQFEALPSFMTNTVENTIDNVRPAGQMTSLPAITPGPQFPIGWAGTDGVGTVEAFSVFVSEDSGPYEPFVQNATITSAIFSGHEGSRYSFFCLARDSAGNVELQNPVAEVSTLVASAGSSFCLGDGTGATCPCGNSSLFGDAEGCMNSLGTGGRLVATGNASLSADTLRLLGSRMPDCPVVYFQGTAPIQGELGAAFGDGLRCVGGTVTRFGMKVNTGGSSQYPGQGDRLISITGAPPAGAVRYYQCWYRNAAAFCTSETFNLTNGRSVTWGP